MKIFEKSGLPSEYMMLPERRAYSKMYREQYYDRLKSDFSIDVEGVLDDGDELRLSLKDGFKLALESIRGNHMVTQQNIRYGFIRNLIGGSYVGFFGCLVLFAIGILEDSQFLIWAPIICSVIYLPSIVFAKRLIIKNGEAFADTVFSVFLS